MNEGRSVNSSQCRKGIGRASALNVAWCPRSGLVIVVSIDLPHYKADVGFLCVQSLIFVLQEACFCDDKY